MRLTSHQQEVMEALRQPRVYLYARKSYYCWSGGAYWRQPVLRRTHDCLRRAGLIERVHHPKLGTLSHQPGMPVWVWVAKEASG